MTYEEDMLFRHDKQPVLFRRKWPDDLGDVVDRDNPPLVAILDALQSTGYLDATTGCSALLVADVVKLAAIHNDYPGIAVTIEN
jgi:hypothetical protein